MAHIRIEQLDRHGRPWRTFTQVPRDGAETDAALHRITYAYMLERTRVSVNGRVVELRRD